MLKKKHYKLIKRNNNSTNNVLGIILICILFMGIGYSYIKTTLGIDGQVSFDIKMVNITPIDGDGKTIGDEVKIGEEYFYVIKNEGNEIDGKITLITKYNLNTSDYKTQDSSCIGSSYGKCSVAFSKPSQYWNVQNGIQCSSYPCDVNADAVAKLSDVNIKGYALAVNGATTYAAKIIQQTGVDVIKGRLLTYQELANLIDFPDIWDMAPITAKSTDTNKKIYKIMLGRYNGADTNSLFLDYWLGSALDSNGIWFASGRYNVVYFNYYHVDATQGVRPILEIPKSRIIYK